MEQSFPQFSIGPAIESRKDYQAALALRHEGKTYS